MYQPVGPISSTDTFLLAAFIKTGSIVTPYIATNNNNTITLIPILNSAALGLNSTIIRNPNVVLQLKVQGSVDKALITIANNASLQIGDINGTLGIQNTNNNTLQLHNSYQGPPSPYILLSGGTYTFSNSTSDLKVNYINTNGNPSTITTVLYPIALTSYFSQGSGSARVCVTNTDIIKALQIFYCSWCRTTSFSCEGFCISDGIPVQSWTTANDCSNNFSYTYCPTGTYCSGTCYAQCANGKNCALSVGKQQMICAGSSTLPLAPLVPAQNTIPLVPLLITSWWLWVIVAIIIIILIIMLIYLYSYKSDIPQAAYTTSNEYNYAYA